MRDERCLRAIWLGLAALMLLSAAASLLVPSRIGSARADAVAICTACHDGWLVATPQAAR